MTEGTDKVLKEKPGQDTEKSQSDKAEGSAFSFIARAKRRVLVVWQIELDFPKGVVSRYSLAVVFLLVLLIISALAVVYSSHYSRELFHELKLKKQTRDDLETEWGQLLLEQSALSAHTRVESAADRYLNMMLPESKDIKLVISNGR